MLAYCTNCGGENRSEAQFCRFCGHNLAEISVDGELAEFSDISPTSEQILVVEEFPGFSTEPLVRPAQEELSPLPPSSEQPEEQPPESEPLSSTDQDSENLPLSDSAPQIPETTEDQTVVSTE
jgi:hypothetical protein